MKQYKLALALVGLPLAFAGCDVLKADSMEAPSLRLTGNVVFNGQPVPVRTPGGAQLQLWETSWERDDPDRAPQAMSVHMNMDGSFSAMTYRAEYDLVLLNNVGPWENDTTRHAIVMDRDKTYDVPVQPYHLIQDESIVYTPPAAGDTTGGRITATFRVSRHVPDGPLVQNVGLYVSTTVFVDQQRRETSVRGSWTYPLVNPPAANPTPSGQSAANPHERVRAQIQTQLNAMNPATNTPSDPITIQLILPSNIRLTRSDVPRSTLYARVGVQTETLSANQRAYSNVHAVNIGN